MRKDTAGADNLFFIFINLTNPAIMVLLFSDFLLNLETLFKTFEKDDYNINLKLYRNENLQSKRNQEYRTCG